MTRVLEDALAEPLVEGPLQPVESSGKRRRILENVPDLDTNDLPLVSIGRPRVWPLSELLADQPLSSVVRASLERESFFVVRLACSFRPRKDEVSVHWARFAVQLLPDERGGQPLAFDLYPRLVERERQVSKKITLNPSLKFLEIEAGAGEFGYAVEYPAVEPVVSAAGFEEVTPSWDFASAPGYLIHGGKLLHAVVAAPRDLQRLAVALSLTADLDYRGFRLPTWLRGDPTQAEHTVEVILWP